MSLMKTTPDNLVKYHALVVKMALRWRGSHRSLDLDDLIQVGYLGLMKARDRFESEKGSFVTYAAYWMNHFFRKHVADFRDVVRVPEGVMFKVSLRSCSLDAPLGDDTVSTHLEMMPAPEPEEPLMADAFTVKMLDKAMKKLTQIEQFVIRARFVEERPLRDIGRLMGVSGERVRQIQNTALSKLRSNPHLMKAAA